MMRAPMADAPEVRDDEGTVQGSPDHLRYFCHELRQPLVVAVGYISMLEDGSFGELPAEAAHVLRTVAERLDAMNAIIDDVASGADAPPA